MGADFKRPDVRVLLGSPGVTYGIRDFLLLMASTQLANVNNELLIALLSTIRSLLLSVRRLSSEPARSIHDARLTLIVVSVVWVTLTQRIACDRLECAFSLIKSASFRALIVILTYFGSRCRTVNVGLIVDLLEFFQSRTWLFFQAYHHRLPVVVPNRQP